MNIMHRLCDRPDWIAPFPGRAHHASWCSDVTHPDMRLMAAAPDLLEALQKISNGQEMTGDFTHVETVLRYQEIARAAIAKATGEPQ